MIHSEPKVLHVGAELLGSTGGTTKAVWDFQRAINGSRVVALCNSEKLKLEGPFDSNWEYVDVKKSLIGRAYLKTSKANKDMLVESAGGLSAIFSHMLFRYNTNLVSWIAKKHKIPYFVVPHGSMDPYVFTHGSVRKALWMSLWGQKFLEGAQGVVFATRREMLKAKHTYDSHNGVVIHWPVDVPVQAAFNKEEIRAKYGLPVNKRLLVSYGRFHSIKRPLELIAIFNELGRNDVGLVLFGPDDDVKLTQCQHLASQREEQIVFCYPAQFGSDLHGLVQACDGYLSWSLKENFNYSLCESLASGLPFIISPGNDLAPDLEEVRGGWVLEDDRDDTLSAAIWEFASLSNEELVEKGERAKKFAKKSLSRDSFSKRIREIVVS